MTGEKEQKCLDLIKQKIFSDNIYAEVSDTKFVKEQTWFINKECHQNYFGLLEEDRNEIEQILQMVKPNVKKSDFPDFVFDYGFIEHFQVSSSKTTRKGAEHIKEMSCFTSKVNNGKKIIEQEWNENPNYDEVRSKHWTMDNPKHSHSFLIKSFKRNWINHINSLDKYTGKKNIGIFMIEYSDYALSMFENVYKDWINGMSQGDMRTPEEFHCYRLTRDRELLNFIYQHKDKIKYVIFTYYNDFEIIRLENIPYLIKLIPWEYVIKPMLVKNMASLYNISDSAHTDFSEN